MWLVFHRKACSFCLRCFLMTVPRGAALCLREDQRAGDWGPGIGGVGGLAEGRAARGRSLGISQVTFSTRGEGWTSKPRAVFT